MLLSRGGYESATTNIAGALADYQRAHNIFSDIGETRSRAITLVNIAGLYQDAKDYQNALKYYAQALDVYHGDTQLELSIYNNRGGTLKDLGKTADAEAEYRLALALARTIKSPVLEGRILRNIASGQLVAGNIAGAERSIAEGARLVERGDNTTLTQFIAIEAQAAFQRGDIGKARMLITRSFAGVDSTQTSLLYREAHQTAFLIYRALGDEANALVHLEAQKRLDDHATKLATSTNTALMAARFDYANQELRIAKLKADELRRNIAFERARAQTQRSIFIGLAVVTLIIVSMLGFGLVTIRRSRNEVRAANIDLAGTNSALGKALAAKTEFLATTSHEIRTPLNGILGMTQVMLADQGLDAMMRDRIGVVHGAGTTMRALVDDILDVAKMETGNLTIEQAPFDLKATLRDVSRLWEEQARAKGVVFTLDLADAPDHVEGDAARLRQIIFNLLSNALKFTDSGSVGVRASTIDGPMLSIAVSDSGIGIPADKFDLIFESFRQVDAGTTRKFGGTGLGLSICRNLAQAMGGNVSVRSDPGHGSTFTLELPLLLAAPPQAAATVEDGVPSALLILDRNPISRSMLRAVLEERAGSVVFASSVEEAVDRIVAGGVAQLLIDDATIKAGADVMSALGTLATAAARSGTRTTLLWPSPDDVQRAAFMHAGIHAVVGKPIAGAALAAMIFPLDKSVINNPNQLVTRAA